MTKEMGQALLDWVWGNTDEYKKLVALVPFLYPHVQSFAKSLGFEHEGTLTKSYLKNGDLHDQWILGFSKVES